MTHPARLLRVAGLCFAVAAGTALGACDSTDEGSFVPSGLVSPTGTQLTRDSTTLEWSVAEPSPVYQVQLVRQLGGRTDTLNALVGDTRYRERVGPGAFTWRVRSVRGVEVGEWSPTSEFRYDRALLPVEMGWFLSTEGLEPNRDYDDPEINPSEVQLVTTSATSLASLRLDTSLVTSARFEALEAQYTDPEDVVTPLDLFESYRIRTPGEPPNVTTIAELASAPAAPTATLTILAPDVPAGVYDGTGVRYRLRVRTGDTVPPAGDYTLTVTGEAALTLDVRGSS